MNPHGPDAKIRSLINAWEDGKLNWKAMQAAAHIVKERRVPTVYQELRSNCIIKG